MRSVFIVEDDPRLRAEFEFLLRDEGFSVTAVDNAEEAFARLTAGERLPALLLADVRLPGESGVDLVRRLAAAGRLPPTVVVSGEASIGEAVEALKLGVHDFLEKPIHRDRLLRTIDIALEQVDLRHQVEMLESELGLSTPILGESEAVRTLIAQIDQVAPTESRVLIRGESGSGKELVADALHTGSARRHRPLIKINCAAIAPQLVEDELFGHVQGAFTDAKADKKGLFEEADGGTLFLDEIGDMELELQARLLRVLEDGRVRRLGSTRERRVDVRLIAATHEDLEEAVAQKTFRQDLYYRLAHLPIEVPALRERGNDIEILFRHFLARYCTRNHRRLLQVEDDVIGHLERWLWPGNVRELKSLAERLAILAADPIGLQQLPEPYRSGVPEKISSQAAEPGEILTLREYRASCERKYIEKVLEDAGGNVSEAARRLDIHRSRLHEKLRTLGIRQP
jgi:DNA-binding NtrC family response regulator